MAAVGDGVEEVLWCGASRRAHAEQYLCTSSLFSFLYLVRVPYSSTVQYHTSVTEEERRGAPHQSTVINCTDTFEGTSSRLS